MSGRHLGEDGVVEDGITADRAIPPRRWPALRILAAVRMAFDGRKLLIATAGILLLQLGWSLLDQIFPSSADVTPNLLPREALPGSSGRFSWPPEALLEQFVEPARNLTTLLFALLTPENPWPVMGHAVLGIAWLIVIWGYCGGAIARIAAIQEARSRQAGIGEALRFARRSGPALILAPVFPLIGILLCSLPGLGLGLLYRSHWGSTIAGGLLFIPLLAGLVMTLLTASLIAGWPMFHSALASGADDALDALGRTYSYLNQRLVLFAVGLAIAGFAGLTGLALVDWLTWGVVWLTRWSLSIAGPPHRIAGLFGRVFIGADPLTESIDPGTAAVAAHRFWLGAVRLLAHSWVYSFFWTAATLVYLWLRQEVDGTPPTVIDPPTAGSAPVDTTAS